MAVAALYWR